MLENRLRSAEFTSADTIADELAAALLGIAEPARPGESMKSVISRAARRLGIPYGQASRIKYREWPALAEHVAIADRLRALARKQQESADRSAALKRENDELRCLLAARNGHNADLDCGRLVVVSGWNADARSNDAAVQQIYPVERRRKPRIADDCLAIAPRFWAQVGR